MRKMPLTHLQPGLAVSGVLLGEAAEARPPGCWPFESAGPLPTGHNELLFENDEVDSYSSLTFRQPPCRLGIPPITVIMLHFCCFFLFCGGAGGQLHREVEEEEKGHAQLFGVLEIVGHLDCLQDKHCPVDTWKALSLGPVFSKHLFHLVSIY